MRNFVSSQISSIKTFLKVEKFGIKKGSKERGGWVTGWLISYVPFRQLSSCIDAIGRDWFVCSGGTIRSKKRIPIWTKIFLFPRSVQKPHEHPQPSRKRDPFSSPLLNILIRGIPANQRIRKIEQKDPSLTKAFLSNQAILLFLTNNPIEEGFFFFLLAWLG